MTHLTQFINYADPISKDYQRVKRDFLWLVRCERTKELCRQDDSKIELPVAVSPDAWKIRPKGKGILEKNTVGQVLEVYGYVLLLAFIIGLLGV